MKRTNKTSQGFGIVPILTAVAVIGLLGVLGYLAYAAVNAPKSVDTSSQITETESTTQTDEAGLQGTITGKTSYPSEMLPADEEVCAERTDGAGDPICVNVGQAQSMTFSLSVPAGEYYVYATADVELPGYKAYYNEYVKCMDIQDGTCGPDTHNEKLVVKVATGQTVSDVEPGDWYANQ